MSSDGAAAGAAPSTLDMYEVLGSIGKGSFGCVSKIRRKSDGRILVWKELNYGSMREKEKQLVVSEVNILRELRHPFIVRYYDRIIDKAATKIYIVMEYCEGGDLGGLIKRCKKEGTSIEEDFVWHVLTQTVMALKECHRHRDTTSPGAVAGAAPAAGGAGAAASGAAAGGAGPAPAGGKITPILHRDIKPGNIFLDGARNIKIGDFGLAKELTSESKFAYTNVGTPFYMSPEMVNECKYNEKSDIWALGCLLYELCALAPPFDATNHLSLAVKINAGKFARIPAKYSEDLHRAIRWMLTLESAKRPSVEDLERIPRVGELSRDAAMIVREYGLNQAAAARMRELRGREEEVARREAAVAAGERSLREREAALAARAAELARAEAAFAARVGAAAGAAGAAGDEDSRRYSCGDRLRRPSSSAGMGMMGMPMPMGAGGLPPSSAASAAGAPGPALFRSHSMGSMPAPAPAGMGMGVPGMPQGAENVPPAGAGLVRTRSMSGAGGALAVAAAAVAAGADGATAITIGGGGGAGPALHMPVQPPRDARPSISVGLPGQAPPMLGAPAPAPTPSFTSGFAGPQPFAAAAAAAPVLSAGGPSGPAPSGGMALDSSAVEGGMGGGSPMASPPPAAAAAAVPASAPAAAAVYHRPSLVPAAAGVYNAPVPGAMPAGAAYKPAPLAGPPAGGQMTADAYLRAMGRV